MIDTLSMSRKGDKRGCFLENTPLSIAAVAAASLRNIRSIGPRRSFQESSHFAFNSGESVAPKTRIRRVYCKGSGLRVWYDCDMKRSTPGRLTRTWCFDVRPNREPPYRRIDELELHQFRILFQHLLLRRMAITISTELGRLYWLYKP